MAEIKNADSISERSVIGPFFMYEVSLAEICFRWHAYRCLEFREQCVEERGYSKGQYKGDNPCNVFSLKLCPGHNRGQRQGKPTRESNRSMRL